MFGQKAKGFFAVGACWQRNMAPVFFFSPFLFSCGCVCVALLEYCACIFAFAFRLGNVRDCLARIFFFSHHPPLVMAMGTLRCCSAWRIGVTVTEAYHAPKQLQSKIKVAGRGRGGGGGLVRGSHGGASALFSMSRPAGAPLDWKIKRTGGGAEGARGWGRSGQERYRRGCRCRAEKH